MAAASWIASAPSPLIADTVTVRVVVPLPLTPMVPVALPVLTRVTSAATRLTESAPA